MAGYGITSMKPIFKTEVLMYQSKVNLEEKILFVNVPHLIDPETRACLQQKIPYSILVHDLPSIEI